MTDRIRQAVDEIFVGYVDTRELRDFKEEIIMNMTDRIQDMVNDGHAEEKALSIALQELGDVTEMADEFSREKRDEIIGQAYGRTIPLRKIHAVGYPLMGLFLALGIVIAAIVFFDTGSFMEPIATVMPFAALSGFGFISLGLTQETRVHLPMNWKRSLLYGFAGGLLIFGIFLSAVVFLHSVPEHFAADPKLGVVRSMFMQINPVASLGVLIPFVLPSIFLFLFLILTEQGRKKPWVLQAETEAARQYDEKFGMLSGALWIFAIAAFIIVCYLTVWYLALVVFLIAAAIQCLIQYFTIKK